jgi:DNA repair protein SbcD/Mre11
MKILHTADWHLGDRLGRIDRTDDLRRSVERIARYCDEEKVDVLLVAGDLFSELSRPDHLRGSIQHLQDVFLPFLRRGGTFVALTGNHDNESFCQTLRHAMLLAAPASAMAGETLPAGRVYLADEPAFFRLTGRDGECVQFLLMPYPTPSRYLDTQAQRYRSLEEKNRALQTAYVARLKQIQEHSHFDARLPTVLAAHIHVQGARLSNPFRISERETILFAAREIPVDYAYVALGHIHQPQCLLGREHVRYSGSIERLDLGERNDEKSVTLFEVGAGGRRGEPTCLPLSATPIHDVQIHEPRTELPQLRQRYPDCEKALVRFQLRYRAGEDNLEEILRELDGIFPRWYARDWSEAGELSGARSTVQPALSRESFQETVTGYLREELADHPDQEAVLHLAEQILMEEA